MAPDLKTTALAAITLLASCGLTGCVDTLEQANTPRRPLVSAAGLSIALVSVDGAPDTVTQRFETALGKEASRREIALVQGSETPRYKLKGYLSAYEVEGGTALSWVWDMYDTTEKRARRVDGAQLVKRNAAEPWSTVDDATLQAAASNSMNEVASYLTNTPSPAAQLASSAGAPASQAVRTAQLQAAPIAAPPRTSIPEKPPSASNRAQPQSLPSVNAFAATFDLPSASAGSTATPAFKLLPQ